MVLVKMITKQLNHINSAYTVFVAHLTTHFAQPSMTYPSISTTSGYISYLISYQHPPKSTLIFTINHIYPTTFYSTNSSICYSGYYTICSTATITEITTPSVVSETANNIPKVDIDQTQAAMHDKKC